MKRSILVGLCPNLPRGNQRNGKKLLGNEFDLNSIEMQKFKRRRQIPPEREVSIVIIL